jgi:endonuclease YncB( thermonuclease family)
MGGADRLGEPVAPDMRPLHAGFAALCVLATSVLIVAGGRAVVPSPGEQEPSTIEEVSAGTSSAVANPPSTGPDSASAKSRSIEPLVVAPPQLDGVELERVAPRQPLSDLALAEPPKPKLSGDWKGTTLFRPFASAAGMVAAQRYSVTIAGIDVVKSDETCLDNGKAWTCGAHALGAFRAFLRGLAIVCAIPADKDRGEFTVRCRSGKKDVGEWLVENGWARAKKGSPYEEAGEKARSLRKGIYGAAPETADVPPLTGNAGTAPQTPDSIIDLSGEEFTPPVGLPEPAQ